MPVLLLVELGNVAESVRLSGKPVDVGIVSDRANASGTVSLVSLERSGDGQLRVIPFSASCKSKRWADGKCDRPKLGTST
jgi:hypothetical protein